MSPTNTKAAPQNKIANGAVPAPDPKPSEGKASEPRNLHEAPAEPTSAEPKIDVSEASVPEPDKPQEKAPTSRRTNKKTEEPTRLVSFAIPVKLLAKARLVCGSEGVSLGSKVVQLLEYDTRFKIKKVVAELTFLED